MNDNREKRVDDLIAKAQGSRSLRQFAEEIGVNASSLSRMRAGLLIPKRDVLERIAEKAEQPGAVSVEELAEAFDHIAEANRPRRQAFEEMRNDEQAQQATILMELLVSGYSIQEMKEIPKDKWGYRYADIVLETNALSSSDNGLWAFQFLGSPKVSSLVDRNMSLRMLRNSLLGVAATFYFGEIRLSRYSIVMTDRGLFTTAKKQWSDYKISDEISFILVDTDSKEILEEFVIPTTDERDPVYPFKKPIRRRKINENQVF